MMRREVTTAVGAARPRSRAAGCAPAAHRIARSTRRFARSTRRFARGLSLIELIIAMVILSIGAVLTIQGLITPAQSIAYDTEIQLATNAAQACAEHIMALRGVQTNGWNNVPAAANTRCDSITPPTGYTRNLSIVNIAAGGNNACLGTFTPANPCREVTITVSKTGGLVPPVVFKFTIINY